METKLSVTELARKLVSFRTVSQKDSNKEITNFLANYLEEQGCHIFRHEYQWQPEEDGDKRSKKPALSKVNLIALKGTASDDVSDAGLAFSGHTDTVPYNDKDWKHDPLAFELVNGRKYYGRGSVDMKASLAMFITAAAVFPAASLKRPLALVLTADEEVGCYGIKRLKQDHPTWLRFNNVIITEPTGFVPVYAHKGYMYLRIKLRGKRGGHSSNPAEGDNVIEKLLEPVLAALREFKENLERTVDGRLDPPYATMNVGIIRQPKDAAKNRIATEIELEFDIRPIPGQDPIELYEMLRHCLQYAIRDIDNCSLTLQFRRGPTPPFFTDPDCALIRRASELSRETPQTVSFNTEAAVFQAAGAADCVVWGPGHIAQAHQPDEFIEANWLHDAAGAPSEYIRQYEAMIRRFCCQEGE